MTASGRELRLTAEARRLALTDGEVNGRVRPLVAESWQRSLDAGVPSAPAFEVLDSLDLDTKLVRASMAPMAQLAGALSGTDCSAFLANEKSVILQRWVESPQMARRLDSALSVQGALLAERSVGTNGLGTVAVTGQPVLVTGPEHWAEQYQDLACAGAPVRNAVTRRLEGVITVTCRASQNHALLLSLVRQAAYEAERALRETATLRERTLLDVFVSATRRSNRAVLVTGGDVLISSPGFDQLSSRVDKALMWSEISEVSRTGSDSRLVVSDSLGCLEARVRAVTQGAATAGVLVELRAMPEARGRSRRSHPSTPIVAGLVGSSAVWMSAVRQVQSAVAAGGSVHIVGEPGTGKFSVAKAVLDELAVPVAVLDGAMELALETGPWLVEARSAAGRDGYLLVRRLELLSSRALTTLSALIEERGDSPRVVCTRSDRGGTTGDQYSPAGVLIAPTVTLPPLRSRPDDLSLLVRHFVRPRPVTSAALDVLTRYNWPGNVRQLRQVLADTGGDTQRPIVPSDLPPIMAGAGRASLTRLERVELTALREAMEEARGNKAVAARLLGVSRSTVYRKLAQLPSDSL
jgi:transcriptional regulator of acetoin/glycerol metabolism